MSISSCLGRDKFGEIRVSGLVEIGVHGPLEVHLGHEFNNGTSLITRARALERTVGVHSGGTPTLDVFISPRTDTWAAQDIEFLSVFESFSLHEK